MLHDSTDTDLSSGNSDLRHEFHADKKEIITPTVPVQNDWNTVFVPCNIRTNYNDYDVSSVPNKKPQSRHAYED